MMDYFLKRTWMEVDLDAIRHNMEEIKGTLHSGTKIIAVVKADAYGHGAEYTARQIVEAGAQWLAVSNLEEALHLRKAEISAPILVLGYTPPQYAGELALNHISQSVFNGQYAEELSAQAVQAGVQVNIHLKVDTGMSRIGFLYHDNVTDVSAADRAAAACRLPGLYPEGIFTHFASADEGQGGEVYTRIQYDLFLDMIARLAQQGIHFELRHCCNSAGILEYPEMQLDAVRPGIILYGLNPSGDVRAKLNLKPAMELKSVISMVKEVDEGTPVSYGRTFATPKKMRVATVPVGYADGYMRCLSGRASMLVDGKPAPVIGRVCMDQLMLDVTDIPAAKEGMPVTVYGGAEGTAVSVTHLAKLAGTINYELLCGISKRVPRIYLKEGRYMAQVDYILHDVETERLWHI